MVIYNSCKLTSELLVEGFKFHVLRGLAASQDESVGDSKLYMVRLKNASSCELPFGEQSLKGCVTLVKEV